MSMHIEVFAGASALDFSQDSIESVHRSDPIVAEFVRLFEEVRARGAMAAKQSTAATRLLRDGPRLLRDAYDLAFIDCGIYELEVDCSELLTISDLAAMWAVVIRAEKDLVV